MKQASTAPILPRDRRELLVVPLRLSTARYRSRRRWWRRSRSISRRERLAEVVIVGLTFLLVGLLFAAVDHAVQPLRGPRMTFLLHG